MLDPATEVLVIDYAPVDDNPGLIIKSIRDELVEIVPGANLGKILYRRGGSYSEHRLLRAAKLADQDGGADGRSQDVGEDDREELRQGQRDRLPPGQPGHRLVEPADARSRS